MLMFYVLYLVFSYALGSVLTYVLFLIVETVVIDYCREACTAPYRALSMASVPWLVPQTLQSGTQSCLEVSI